MSNQKPRFPVPQAVPVENLTPEVLAALHTLAAFAINENTPLMNFNLNGLTNTATGFPLGSYRITIEKTQ